MKNQEKSNTITHLPLLPLRGLTVLPHMLITLDASRIVSVNAIEAAMQEDQQIFIVTQQDFAKENPVFKDFYSMGTVASVKQMLKLPNNNVRVLVEGIYPAKLVGFSAQKPYITASVERISCPKLRLTKTIKALIRQISTLFEEYAALSNHVHPDILMSLVMAAEDPEHFFYSVLANINLPVEKKQQLFEMPGSSKRLETLIRVLMSEVELLKIESEIQSKVREKIDRNQREYFLREQIKVIQGELGDREDVTMEINEYIKKMEKCGFSEEVRSRVLKEINRLQLMPSGSHEATVVRTYLDTVFELPWNKKTKENIDLAKCERILDKDHYGLTKVKERIVEYLAVKSRTENKKGMILCLIGPPGVGKTSVVSSIAKAVGRNFVRLSLGGVRDEADIRGHRKTYIGAMPGRIINAVKLAGSKNPLILLDEIDKMASDFRGDPASALLEVLDREQNHAFRDHYLEIPFDLSDVMFITTANTATTIPQALYDRMEVIELSSYTALEKENIAKKYLVPKQLKEHGVTARNVTITPCAISELIHYYTMEAGVRGLERQVASLVRKAVFHLEKNQLKSIKITKDTVSQFLGARKVIDQSDTDITEAGVATGLAYTSYGGALLNIEVNILEGNGKVELTGHLGEVMKESASASISYIRANAGRFHLDPAFYQKKDIHVHVPEGATPKDGPSAGITMTTAIVSALTGRPVRKDTAMTGEVTIRGRVLAIGGLKEKSLAAHRAKITRIIIPWENQKDIEEIPVEIRDDFTFIPVRNMDEVLKNALKD